MGGVLTRLAVACLASVSCAVITLVHGATVSPGLFWGGMIGAVVVSYVLDLAAVALARRSA